MAILYHKTLNDYEVDWKIHQPKHYYNSYKDEDMSVNDS